MKNDKKRGIYFLINKAEIVYVGQSFDIYSRIASHKSVKDFDSYTFIEYPNIKREDLIAIEEDYILKFQPLLNGKYSLTLKRSFSFIKDKIKKKNKINKLSRRIYLQKIKNKSMQFQHKNYIYKGVVYLSLEDAQTLIDLFTNPKENV